MSILATPHAFTTNHFKVSHLVASASALDAARGASRQLIRLLAVSDEGVRVGAEWVTGGRGVDLTWSATGLTAADMSSALASNQHLRPRREAKPRGGDLSVFAVDALPGRANRAASAPIGFASELAIRTEPAEDTGAWARCGIVLADELVAALREAKASLRIVALPATAQGKAELRAQLAETTQSSAAADEEYVGTPIAVEMLVAVPGDVLAARVKAVIASAVPHVRFRSVGRLSEPEVLARWQGIGAHAQVLPASVAQALLLVPAVHPSMAVVGIGVEEAPAVRRPMRHKTGRRATLVIGRATGPTGAKARVALTPRDACRHTQVVGQTGAGKSTAAVAYALAAARAGHGLTFLDPHGSTVRRLLTLLSEDELKRTVYFSLGDIENPVRACMWPSLDPGAVEQVIAELNALFREIFDPHSQGIVGPRFERWFALNAKANVALLGRHASFATIAALSATPESSNRLARAIRATDPDTARALESEYGDLGSKEFTEILGWAASKMERFTSVAALRETFGSGADGLDFATRIANKDIVLIDLAMPSIGAAASQMAGTLLLHQLWRAFTSRGPTDDESDTHFVFIDEAQRFQFGALPAMLAEGRKFGVAMTVIHQHLRQLAAEVREGLEANTGALMAFRASLNDTRAFEVRLGSDVAADLSRLGNLTALASLCVDGTPTPVFTVEFAHPPARRDAGLALVQAEARTRATLVEPFRSAAPLSGSDAIERLKQADAAQREKRDAELHARRSALESKYKARRLFDDDGADPDVLPPPAPAQVANTTR